MSDLLSHIEIDNNKSYEYNGNDDGIVPDSACKDGGQFPVLVSSKKKRRHGDINSRTKSNSFIKREGNMLGKKSGSPLVSRDEGSVKDIQEISEHGFNSGGHKVDEVENFTNLDPMLCDSSAGTHEGMYDYSIINTTGAETNLSFLNNGDKESNDLFYGWGDIGNFEEVDKMLRSCDSTFGLDNLTNENDDLCWFSSAQPNEDTDVTMTDDVKPDIMSENQRTLMTQVEDFLNNNDSDPGGDDEYGYNILGGSVQEKSSENASDKSLQKKDILMLDEEVITDTVPEISHTFCLQANLEKKQTNLLHLDEKSDGYSENSFSGISREIMDTNRYYPLSTFHQPGVPYSHFNCEQPSACESKSGIKSENKPNPSSISNESYTSADQAQSVQSLQGPSPTVDDQCRKGIEKRVMPSSLSTRKSSKRSTMVSPNTAPTQKMGPEQETSTVEGSSCVSSVVDDVSLEATSFRQLQQVIEQLDVRTKLCIRDSLYRLAKSAENRHNYMNPNGGNRHEKGTGAQLVTGETDKYVGFMDIETDTNPIDRSIAHLLFHRPSESSPPPTLDTDILSYKSHPMIPHPNSSPSLRIDNQEEPPGFRTESEVVTGNNK